MRAAPREKEGRGACECSGAERERDEEARVFEAKEGEGVEKQDAFSKVQGSRLYNEAGK